MPRPRTARGPPRIAAKVAPEISKSQSRYQAPKSAASETVAHGALEQPNRKHGKDLWVEPRRRDHERQRRSHGKGQEHGRVRIEPHETQRPPSLGLLEPSFPSLRLDPTPAHFDPC